MNRMPKVVVSTTLTDPAWNNTTVIASDVPGQVTKLKEQYEGDVLVPASATLVDTLRAHDLVDEYRLMVHPVVLGQGKRLFKEDAAGHRTRAGRLAQRSAPTCCYSPTVRPGRASAGGVPPTARHTRAALRHGQSGGGAAPARARPYQDPVHIVRATSRSASASIRPSWRARSRIEPQAAAPGRDDLGLVPGAHAGVGAVLEHGADQREPGRGATPRAGSQISSATRSPKGSAVSSPVARSAKAAMAAAPSSALVGQRR